MKPILLSLFFFFQTIISFSQTHLVQDIPIRFDTLPAEKILKVKTKSPLRIIIRDINKKLYKVEDEKSDKDYNITLPESLKGLSAPSFLQMRLPKLSAIGPSTFYGVAGDPLVAPDTSDVQIEKLLNIIESSAAKLDSAILYSNYITQLSIRCKQSEDEIILTLQRETLLLLKIPYSAEYSIGAIDTLLKSYLGKIPIVAKKALEDLKNVAPGYIYKLKSRTLNSLKKVSETITTIEKDLQKKNLTQEDKNIAAENLKINYIRKDSLEMTQDIAGKLEKKIDAAEKVVEEIISFEKDNKLFAVLTNYRITSNRYNYRYISQVIIPKKDETKIIFTITPTGLNECNEFDKRISTITIKAKGRLKVDYSAGLFLNMGNNRFYGPEYFYNPTGTDSKEIAVAERGKRMMLSIGGLVHIYKRSYNCVKPGFSLGASTTANFDDLNFHAGPSLIIGNKNRFILTAGITGKTSKILDSRFKENLSYPTEDLPDDIPTVSIFPVWGYFIGLTYNLNFD